jgi:molybdopterin-synthase adenylyltransferase
MGARITLLESHERSLRGHLEAHRAGHERAAVVLFRRIVAVVPGLAESDRYVSVEVHPFLKEWITSSSNSHIAFETRPLRDFFRRCKEEGLVFGFVHNHPTGFPDFSDVDEENERMLLSALTNRNGKDTSLVGLLLVGGAWKARTRRGIDPSAPQPARHVIVTGRPLQIHVAEDKEVHDEYFARQIAAFGKPFVRMMSALRGAVVGGGGTGSPTATLLARSGIGELVIIDPDRLDKSNLNRVRGARTADVNENKARILAQYIEGIGLPTKAAYVDALIDMDPDAVDALASCDVVFGCTDDQIGRELLNTAAYVYAMPFIDVGLGGKVIEENGRPVLRYHHGRVSTILPEQGECLSCQDVIREGWVRRQYALREKPEMTEAEAKERYLEGGGEEAPGVGPFTSAIADYGVATLYDLISPFRRFPPELRWDAFSVDFVKMQLRSRERKNDEKCVYCATREYLVMAETVRLGRASLGSRNAAY